MEQTLVLQVERDPPPSLIELVIPKSVPPYPMTL
jgi:hypothetical protein